MISEAQLPHMGEGCGDQVQFCLLSLLRGGLSTDRKHHWWGGKRVLPQSEVSGFVDSVGSLTLSEECREGWRGSGNGDNYIKWEKIVFKKFLIKMCKNKEKKELWLDLFVLGFCWLFIKIKSKVPHMLSTLFTTDLQDCCTPSCSSF